MVNNTRLHPYNFVTLDGTDCFVVFSPPSVNGQHPGTLRGWFEEGGGKKKKGAR